jgi:hypothetical protein
MKYPNDPKGCRKVLFNTYDELKDADDLEWGKFSHEFNRHIRLKISICGGKKQKAFRYLFSAWQSLNRLRGYRHRLLMVPKAVTERRHLVLIKEALNEALANVR